MRAWKWFLVALLSVCCAVGAAACGGGAEKSGEQPQDEPVQEEPENPNRPSDPPISEDPQESEKKEIVGVYFPDGEATYDGTVHTITVSGELPTGVTVVYKGNSAIDAGEYAAEATLSGEGYLSRTLTAKLTVHRAKFTGIDFPDRGFAYDGEAHGAEVVGVLPAGTAVSYQCDSEEGGTATQVGEYTVRATLENPNFETLTLTARLVIFASERERSIAYENGVLYFANALDGDALYAYRRDGLERISSDVPYGFAEVGGTLYFRSYTGFASSIRKITLSDGFGVDSVAMAKGEYLTTDGTSLFYAVNGLTNGKSGVYRLNPTDPEPTPELISSGKAKYLTYANGSLYFADGANGWELARVSVSGGSAQRTPVLINGEPEQVNALVCAEVSGEPYLFFTVERPLGNYIANYRLSDGKSVKLTVDAGADLTVLGNDLYYINLDRLTSSVFGKGICRVDACPDSDRQLSGDVVIGEEGARYGSLSDGGDGRLAYYEVSEQMLCLYTPSNGETRRILENFTPPEKTPSALSGKVFAYGNSVYWTDPYNGMALSRYEEDTGEISRITANRVDEFAVVGGMLYFNAVSFGVNNDLYRVDLEAGGEAELVSKNDACDLTSDGTRLFYVYRNAAGVRTSVHRIDAEGHDMEIYSKGVNGLCYENGFLYFEDGNCLMRMPSAAQGDDAAVTVYDGRAGEFEVYEGVIYFRELYGIGWGFKRLSRVNPDGSDYAVLAETTDPVEIEVSNGRVYYVSEVTFGAQSGLYRIPKQGGEAVCILPYDSEGAYRVCDFTLSNGRIYFLNSGKDSHLYRLETDGEPRAEQIA